VGWRSVLRDRLLWRRRTWTHNHNSLDPNPHGKNLRVSPLAIVSEIAGRRCLATIGWHGWMRAAGAFNGLPRELRHTALRFSLIANVPPVLRGSSPAGHDQPACRQALSTTQARPREAQAQVTDDPEPARSRAQSKNRGDDHYNCSGGHDPSCNPTYASQNSLNSEFPHNVFV
jgi:hypothetical protein